MPNPAIEGLARDSADDVVDEAISSCIANEVRRGRGQDQAIAMCHQLARDKTGKQLTPKGKRFPTMKG